MALTSVRAACIAALAATAPAQAALPMGTHRMVLDCPGGELPFYLQLAADDAGGFAAHILNGSERIKVPQVLEGDGLVLRFAHYDSELRLDDTLSGVWIKRRGDSRPTEMKVHRKPAPTRFPRTNRSAEVLPPDWCIGRFRVAFANSRDPAVGVFRRANGHYHDFEGTFLTTLGDYRFLAGNADADGFSLSCFDGAHAFLFRARPGPGEGSIRGDFWSSDSWHETWTATRDPTAELPDGWRLTRWRTDARIGDTHLTDLDGKSCTLEDEGLRGQVRVVELFGSWCPNCHDHGHYMAALHRRYENRGLRVVGIAFEHRGDLQHRADQVRAFARRHGITYPLWLGGDSDKAKATAALGLLDRVRAFPTTLFIDRNGRIRGVYQGWSGPATGAAHTRLCERFEELVETLLRER